MITYRPISFADINSKYQSLLPYPLYKRIQAKRALNRLIGFEAVHDNHPIACIAADYFKELKRATLLAWKVDPRFQHQGIGTELYQNLTQALGKGVTLSIFYLESLAVSSLLKKFEWSNPQLYLEQYVFEHRLFHPDWFEQEIPIPKGLQIIPWKDLSQADIARIKRQEDQYTFEISVSPFGEEENIDLYSSLALLQDGEVKGWMVNHFYAPDTIRYSALYVDRDLRLTGAGIALLAESIRLNQKGPMPFAVFEVNLHEIDPSWKRFVQKRLKPSSIKVIRMYTSQKIL